MKPRRHILFIAALLSAPSLHAAVILSDMGATAPTAYDTGYLGTLNDRLSFDTGDSYGQSFTVASSGTMKYLYVAYNAGGGGSFKVSIDTNYSNGGASEITTDAAASSRQYTINIADFITDLNGLSGSSTDTNSGPGYWFRLDFSSENIPLTANQKAAFFFQGLSETTTDDSNFIFAPRWFSTLTSDQYAGGTIVAGTNFNPTGSGQVANSDFGFAVIPEPSSALLGGLGMMILLRRRRA